jgi:hypothetical protein
VTIVIKNMNELKKAMREGNLAVIEGARKAVTEITNDVARESRELVPFDTGNLARSRVVKYPKINSDEPKGEIAYGGPGAPYAVVQHEDLTLFHPPKPPGKSKVGGRQGKGPVAPGTGRGPKYLAYPLMRKKMGFNKLLIKTINKQLRGKL